MELTDAGRAVAQPLLLAEQDRLRAEQRAAEVVVLPLVPAAGLPADGTSATDLAVVSTPRLLAVLGMRTISWTALSFQPALLAVHFGADGTQREFYTPLVIPSDVSIHLLHELFWRDARPFTPIIHFRFQSAEKAFACGIIR
ncbi:hypothetical protein ECO9450_23631 [Escherichia coli O103:H2 str. CVM9450]|nr:hypothetical protein ECO9450_23631 [Escherichia coli O103:H2 str. CVM9450]